VRRRGGGRPVGAPRQTPRSRGIRVRQHGGGSLTHASEAER